ncbi:alpha-glucosidase [Mesobaculum littorinae]|uniref:Alpha-glucosidase n=1 Tax=Mesobaculum littorinae TaxID=2486419 RepID=A0A438AMQ2_9RHOB|nr:alpha-glucosidase [Mesobaculum littorinae]RVV99962.1 alpha-glucosidase [Mesobaculum littorinae]
MTRGDDRHTPWWRDKVGYQIYPRSFADSNGDGIGDIPGIIDRLDHLDRLGVGFIWLSPVYRSPMVDNGYDISDYRDVAPEYGTLDDLERLLAEARARDIGIVMDLVVNHSSDRHVWFEAARADRGAPTRDYYIWRDPAPDGGPPDDRRSFFGGPAWTLAPETGQYYLGLFSPAQPDLNWRNPALRAEIYQMMNWWLDRGIAGFRMDVIDLIGKDIETGEIEQGPYLHPYLQEMHAATFGPRDVVTIGESWNVSPETALLYCGRDRAELDMVFHFEHIVQDWDPEVGKWRPQPFSLPKFKAVFARWQEALAEDGWNSLFLSNHDLPRQVSRYGDDSPRWRAASAKMLATVMHLMRGTPFIYQGEEIGMTNADFTRIDQFRDLETLNLYAEQTAKGMSVEDFIAGANANGRDNARTPVQWTGGPQAGFTTGSPWIGINANHASVNVAAQQDDPDSVLSHYRRLVALRKQHPVIVEGRFALCLPDHPAIFAYTRTLGATRLSVAANFTDTAQEVEVPAELAASGTTLIATAGPRAALEGRITLVPFEAIAILQPG